MFQTERKTKHLRLHMHHSEASGRSVTEDVDVCVYLWCSCVDMPKYVCACVRCVCNVNVLVYDLLSVAVKYTYNIVKGLRFTLVFLLLVSVSFQ